MAKLSHNDSRRMYSWWWDSHISPKNSKWLQQNLTDMDSKVKSMIKLIEEDADSFARRAEMYYKKRPELMKMVEEFYRAYRALAERYDHATGVIRQAHNTMSEACPDHFPMMFGEDSPSSNTDMKTPDMSTMDGDFEPIAKRKSAFGSGERVKRSLNFNEGEENRKWSESYKESGGESEEISKLKEAIAKLEAEKEDGLIKYQQSLDKLSQLEAEMSKPRENFEALNGYAKKADEEVAVLKESLSRAEAEKESNLHEYQNCLEKISNLQNCKEKADFAESEVSALKIEVEKLSSDKESALSQYMQSLETISSLENKLRMSEEDAICLKEKAEKAENEIEALRETVSKLTQEKESSALSYNQCLEKISSLELKLARAEEEAMKLNDEVNNSASKLKGFEEKCKLLENSNQSLHSELESLTSKMGTQTEELTEKQNELGRLWTCVQEERMRFVEAETAFQTLQRLHAQTQEELRATAFELQNRAQILNAVEKQKQNLEAKVSKFEEEKKSLDELNASISLSIKDMRNEISSLIESNGNLQREVEHRVDERNSLQQEIYCLKEELNNLRKKHGSFLDQIHIVGLSPESFGSSVKELKEENSNLRESCRRETDEKTALLEKLAILDKLLEKNSLLETSLSELNDEVDSVRGKIEALEKSCETLSQEKSSLVGEKDALDKQLKEANVNLEKLSKENSVLANSLAEAQQRLEALNAKSKILEDSCQMLVNEKAGLASVNDGLNDQLRLVRTRFEELEKIHRELEGRCLDLENEKESNLRRVEELQMNLEMERQEHEESKTRVQFLQGESLSKSVEIDHVLANAMDSEIELFVLRQASKEMKEGHCSLLEESALSEKKIESLLAQVDLLRAGNGQLFEALDIFEDRSCKDIEEKDELHNRFLVKKIQEMKAALLRFEEESLLKSVDSSVLIAWIEQLKMDLRNIELEKNEFEFDVREKADRISALLLLNEELSLKLKKGDLREEALTNRIHDLREKCDFLEKENSGASYEKTSLEGKNDSLSYENEVLSEELFGLENSSSIFRICAGEKFALLKQFEGRLQESELENAQLKEILTLKDGVELKLKEAEDKLCLEGNEKLQLRKKLDDLTTELGGLERVRDQYEGHIRKLSADNEQMNSELKEKIKEIDELENESALMFGELQCLSIIRLSYEQKFHALRRQSLGYADQNEALKAQLAAYDPEIASLKECITSLENHTDIHIKFQNPEDRQGEKSLDELRDLRVRLESVVKSAVEVKEQMLRENASLQSKLELLHSRRRPASEITEEADNANLLTKDIVLDQVSDGSSYGLSKREHQIDSDDQIIELWGHTDGSAEKAIHPKNSNKLHRVRSSKSKRSSTDDPFFGDMANKRKVLERLDSDVQKLANLQITVRDLKRILQVTEKGKRGKAVIECEAMKGQLEDADVAVAKLLEVNARLTKNVEEASGNNSSSGSKTSFDFDGESWKVMRRVLENAKRASEKIGRLQMEVQRVQFVLLKMDDDNKGKSSKLLSESKRRVLLRDYLYGGGGGKGRTANTERRKKVGNFCACMQPSTVED